MDTVTLTLDVLQLAAVQKALEASLINTQMTIGVIHGQIKEQIDAAAPKAAENARHSAWKAHAAAHSEAMSPDAAA